MSARDKAPELQPESLQERAARLWPDSIELQAEWCRAVDVVRSTADGWRLDNPAPRITEQKHTRAGKP